jgi:hypothetical protein
MYTNVAAKRVQLDGHTCDSLRGEHSLECSAQTWTLPAALHPLHSNDATIEPIDNCPGAYRGSGYPISTPCMDEARQGTGHLKLGPISRTIGPDPLIHHGLQTRSLLKSAFPAFSANFLDATS